MRYTARSGFGVASVLVVTVGLITGGLGVSAAAYATGSSAAPVIPSGSGAVAGTDPSLAVMNQARNHAMGSTIPTDDPSADASAGGISALAGALPPGVQGLDVSGWQTNVNWSQVAASGAKFAYVKATENTNYVSSQFSQQYNGAYAAGLIRGAYHFAVPNASSGAAQAQFFVAHGGGWSADGKTLPPLLDIEYDPYTATDHTNTCYGLSPSQMVAWIASFSNTMLSLTGRPPAIYSTTNWWSECTGNSASFANNPLFIARYPNSISEGAGALPAGWSSYDFWQWADAGTFPGDQDVFNGSYAALQDLALGGRLAGQDEYGTSAALSSTFSPGVPVAYVASGTGYADALSGAAAAGANKGPVLLVQPTAIPAVIAAELTRLKPARIVVLGGTGAVTASVQAQLQPYTTGTVTRLSGTDRYGTSAAVAATFAIAPPVAYIATGADFPDALSGAALAAGSSGGPMLLVTADSIPDSIAQALTRLQPGRIVILGGSGAVSDDVAAALQGYTTGTVTRLAGADRYATSAAVSATFAPGVSVAYVAVGTNYPDALSGAAVAGVAGVPVLLVEPFSVPASIAAELSRLQPTKIEILGGPGAVSTAVATTLQTYVR